MLKQFHPISFSFPETKVRPIDISGKTHLLSTIIPGKQETYIYPEHRYYDELAASYFVQTQRKGGWDCMRHYEILGCGSVPLFVDIEYAPPFVMFQLPRDLLLEARSLYDQMSREGITAENKDLYSDLCARFRAHFEKHLTSRRMAEYVLRVVGATESARILYLSPPENLDCDYLRCGTLVGFKHLMGANCHEYPKLPHIYKGHNENLGRMWGRAVTIEGSVDSAARNDSLDATVVDDILAQKYDFIIYGISYKRKPLSDLVREHYPPEKIITFDGDDRPHFIDPAFVENTIKMGKYHFLREFY